MSKLIIKTLKMKDYSMGFKNRDIDRFSNKFGKQEDPPKKDDPPKKKDGEKKKMEVSKENSQKIRKAKIAGYEKELNDLRRGKGPKAEERRKELLKLISVHQEAIKRAAND